MCIDRPAIPCVHILTFPHRHNILPNILFRTREHLLTPSRPQTSGELLGVIECVNKRGGAFDDDDKYFIDIFASVTAATLDSLRLIKSLKARFFLAPRQITQSQVCSSS